ncbi:MAG TPA: hypothetical protein VJV04_10270 [Nitrospiraceae bacterium]|nr:hypothetical protein [Nitrospiraceae bacterium]
MANVHYGEKKRERHTWIAGWFGETLLWIALSFMALNASIMAPSISLGQSTTSMINLMRGEVTAIGLKQVVIGSKPYIVTDDVVIKDDREQPLELKNISIGDRVAFHLRQGLIDQLVLVLPK